MAAVLEWAGDDEEPVPASFPSSQHRVRGRRLAARPGELPPDIEAAIWRGNQLGSPVTSVVASGFAALDAEEGFESAQRESAQRQTLVFRNRHLNPDQRV